MDCNKNVLDVMKITFELHVLKHFGPFYISST